MCLFLKGLILLLLLLDNTAVLAAEEAVDVVREKEKSSALEDQARLIFDLGDVTINFVPLFLLLKLVLLGCKSK